MLLNNLYRHVHWTPFKLKVLVIGFILLTSNITFFSHVIQVYSPGDNLFFLSSLSWVIGLVSYVLISLSSLLFPLRLVLAVWLIVAAVSAYFSDQFGTVIDKTMLLNILQTNPAEAKDLVSWTLFVRLALFGILPAMALFILPIRSVSFRTKLQHNSAAVLLSCVLAAINLFAFSSHYASFFREHKPLRYHINPLYPMYSALRFAADSMTINAHQTFVAVASNAEIPEEDVYHELVIVVVGETARADHFSLNGYQRNTNPLLSAIPGVISYTDISSCGTSTAISVPCMFALQGRKDFEVEASKTTENVLDLAQQAGVSVLWRDNNSDSKGVAERIEYQSFRSPKHNRLCDTECRDVGMLDGLQAYVDAQSKDVLIVLHQMGSHGPAYFKRYPAEFERYTPACDTVELSNCSDQEIINAYDNSILYTDYFLSQVIAFLQANTPKWETTMLYISDHGESLGEAGLYLHGMPYMFAPEAQTKVPLIAWVGSSSDVNYEQSVLIKDRANSHDAFAQAIISALEVETDAEFLDVPELFVIKPEY